MSTTIKGVWQNVPGRLSRTTRERIIRDNMQGRDVGAFGESAHSVKEGIFNRLTGTAYYTGNDTRLPIVYRTTGKRKADATATLTATAYPDTPVGAWGAGPNIMDAGVNNAVRLVLDGLTFWLLSFHHVPSVTRPTGGTKAGEKGRAERRRLHDLETAQIAAMTRAMRDLTPPGEKFRAIAVGDGNAPWSYPGWSRLKAQGWRAADQRGDSLDPKGVQAIDLVLYIGDWRQVKARSGPNNESDHHPRLWEATA